MSLPMPHKTSGKVILIAHVTCKAGHGDEVQKMIAAIRALAESDDEKETLTYRTTRGEGPGNEDTFAVFEEYILPDGIAAHIAAAPFQTLSASGLVESLDIKYYEEFSQ